jgi:hypothetical protein
MKQEEQDESKTVTSPKIQIQNFIPLLHSPHTHFSKLNEPNVFSANTINCTSASFSGFRGPLDDVPDDVFGA